MNDSYYEGAKDALQLMVGSEATITVDSGCFTVTLSEETFRYPIDTFSWRYENDTPIEEPELDLKTRLKIKHGLLPPPPKPEHKTTAEERYCEAKCWIREKGGLTLEEAVKFIAQYRFILYHPPIA